MKKKRIASLLLAGVMTVSALTGCGGGGQESGDSAPEVSGETTAEQKADRGSKEAKNVKDTLTLAAQAEPDTMDPCRGNGVSNNIVMNQIYDGLVEYHEDGTITPPSCHRMGAGR